MLMMKIFKLNKKNVVNIFTAIIIGGSLLSCSTEDLEVVNTNDPTLEQVTSDPKDLYSFGTSTNKDMFQSIIGFSGVYMECMSDNLTTTNAFRSFWDFAEQPRLQLSNLTTYSSLRFNIGGPWNSFNGYVSSSNIIIDKIENGGKASSGDTDYTQAALAGAYFNKGVSQGYLSMLYDKGFIVDPNTDANNLTFSTYKELMTAALANIEKAIKIAEETQNFTYQLHANSSLNKDLFIKVAYSYAARILISNPRTDAEASSIDYGKVLDYANKGIKSDWFPPTLQDQLSNTLQGWATYVLNDGAGYLPTDLKITSLFDSSYPKNYPAGSAVLEPAKTNDPRLEEYWDYTAAFGYLRSSRNKALFSNYKYMRYWYKNNENVTGIPLNFFPYAEIQYIKAEAYYRQGNLDKAAEELNASPRKTKGLINTGNGTEEIKKALFYENSVELFLACGIGQNWCFMRRHDLLQKGTPTMYPVPATELEVNVLPTYTFGGVDNAGEVGTASGANDWTKSK